MLHNRSWLLLVSMLALISFVYTCKAVKPLYHYLKLDARTVATEIEWKVKSDSDEEYFIQGNYSFETDNQTFKDSDLLPESYLNSWAANREIKRLTMKPTLVWFDRDDPQRSSLQKSFPLKEWISVAVLWGIVIYFIFLGFYAQRLE